MKTKSSLVRSDCRVELYSVTIVYLNLSLIINPGNAEKDLSLGSGDSLKKSFLAELFLISLDHNSE